MAKQFGGNAEICKTVFQAEADALKDLDHPNCVKCFKIYGNGEPGSTLILNLISGMDLNKAIMKQERWQQNIPKADLIDMLCQMAETVRFLHCEQYLVHRDLHWGNWMITPESKMILIDFGVSNKMGPGGISKDFWVTEQFMSPQ